jgi:hypothetical protein
MAKLTLGIVVKSLFGSDLPRKAGEISRSIIAIARWRCPHGQNIYAA